MEFIKQIRKTFNTNFNLVISSEKGLSNSLKRSFKVEDIHLFPKKKTQEQEDKEMIYKFMKGKGGDRLFAWTSLGKRCFADNSGEFQPNIGERWFCKIKMEMEKFIILTLIKKV